MAAEVSLGWNNDKLLAGSKQAEAIVQRTASQMQSTLGKASGGGAFRSLGQVSLQVQDIAVQLQAGTKAATVFAQQGTQILSAFGAGGAIAGGALAIGAAFYTMQQEAEKAFQSVLKETADFDASFRRIAAGTIPEMIDGINKMTSRARELHQGLKDVETTMVGMVVPETWREKAAGLGLPVFSTEDSPQRKAYKELIRLQEEGRAKLVQRIKEESQLELDMMRLKAEGRNEEAAQIERQIELRRRLAEIEQLPIEVQEPLKQNANASFSAATKTDVAKKQAADVAKAFAETQKLIDAQNKLADIKRAAALESANIWDREKLLTQEIAAEEQKQAALRADFVPDQLAIVSSEERLLRLKQDLQRTQRQIADESWRAAEAQDAARLAAQKEADSKVNINGSVPAAAPGEGSTKARQSARQSRGLSGYFEQQNQSSQFDRLQQAPSQFEQAQQGMSAFQRLQFQAAQDRAAGPVMPMPAPAANTPPAASDPRPIVQAIQTLPEEIARRLLGQ